MRLYLATSLSPSTTGYYCNHLREKSDSMYGQKDNKHHKGSLPTRHVFSARLDCNGPFFDHTKYAYNVARARILWHYYMWPVRLQLIVCSDPTVTIIAIRNCCEAPITPDSLGSDRHRGSPDLT